MSLAIIYSVTQNVWRFAESCASWKNDVRSRPTKFKPTSQEFEKFYLLSPRNPYPQTSNPKPSFTQRNLPNHASHTGYDKMDADFAHLT